MTQSQNQEKRANKTLLITMGVVVVAVAIIAVVGFIFMNRPDSYIEGQVEGTNIRMFDSQDLGAPNSVGPIPFSFLFPQRLKNPRLAPGQDWQVALSEDMMLVYDAWFEAGKTYEIVLLVD